MCVEPKVCCIKGGNPVQKGHAHIAHWRLAPVPLTHTGGGAPDGSACRHSRGSMRRAQSGLGPVPLKHTGGGAPGGLKVGGQGSMGRCGAWGGMGHGAMWREMCGVMALQYNDKNSMWWQRQESEKVLRHCGQDGAVKGRGQLR